MKVEKQKNFKKPNIAFIVLNIVSGMELIIFKNPFLTWTLCKVLAFPVFQHFLVSKRVAVHLKAILKTETGKAFLVDIQNLSKSGFLIALEKQKTDFPLEIGEMVHVHFVLESQLLVRCSAVIVRQHQVPVVPLQSPHYGMKITQIDSSSRGRIYRFLEEVA